MPQCPKDDCQGSCVEKAGDWWYCGDCECWYPGAHLRWKGVLGKKSKKSETKSSPRKKKTTTKKPLMSIDQDKPPAKTRKSKTAPKKRPKGIRRPRF